MHQGKSTLHQTALTPEPHCAENLDHMYFEENIQ